MTYTPRNHRLLIIMCWVIVLFSLLTWRLIDVQMVHGEEYRVKAENNRFYVQRLPARRGVILDRYHDPLLWNEQKYYQIVNPGQLYEKKVPVDRDTALQVLSSSQSATIVTDTQRFYRYSQPLSHVLGYMGVVTAEDLQHDSSLSVDQHIGKSGLELMYEKKLRGSDGKLTLEVNAVGQKLGEVHRQEPQNGEDITTSLDPYLTQIAANALGDQRGSVVMTDAQTGKILVMTSKPSFDPNIMSEVYVDKNQELARQEQIRQFFADPQNVFFNRAVSAVYPPGSIFKLAASLAGLESGKITESTQVVDDGKLKVGSYEFGNWYFRQYGKVEGSLGLVRALSRSNDIYFYKVAEWVGPDTLATMAQSFGLGEKTGIDLPGESAGIMPTPSWKEDVKGEKWFLGDTYHMGIGQGDILTSPIQIAQMTQALANNGSLCKVAFTAEGEPECRQVSAQSNNIDLILRGMVGACSAGGTAFPFFQYNTKRMAALGNETNIEQQINGGMMGCKTGTAEFGYADEKGNRKTHAWFTSIIGFPQDWKNMPSSTTNNKTPWSPAEVSLHDQWIKKVSAVGFPKRVTITVMVESDDANPYKEGSADGGAVAKKIVDWMTQ